MVRKSSFFLILIAWVSLLSETQTQTEANQKKLFGPIRTLRVERSEFLIQSGKSVEGSRMLKAVYKFDDKGNIIESVNHNSDGSFMSKKVFLYDDKGNRIEESHYKSKDSLESKQAITYNEAGQQTQSLKYNVKGMLIGKTVYVYDPRGKLVEETSYEKEVVSSKTSYDEKGKITEKVSYDKTGAVETRQVYTRDPQRNRVEIADYNADNSPANKTITVYDAEGNILNMEYYKPDGSRVWRWAFRRDSKGNVIEEEYASPSGLVKQSFAYEYDSFGNWTKKVTSQWFSVSGKATLFPMEAVYRNFSYEKGMLGAVKEIPDPDGKVVLQGEAIVRVQPSYPSGAQSARVRGTVVVEIMVDMEGNVISAKTISGPPLLRAASEDAAQKWKFKPTLLNDVPVKVIGTVTFNYVP